MSALNTRGATIAVILGGTPVTLSDSQNLDSFTVNAASQTFTVPVTGNYLVSYSIKTTAALLMSSRVLRNGVAIPGPIVAPAVAINMFNHIQIVALTSGDMLTY